MKKQVNKDVENIATGQVETGQPTNLDMIFGGDGSSKYSTLDEKDYIDQLSDMNLSDLQAHAYTVELVPVQDRNLLTKRLVREFRRHVASYRRPTETRDQTVIDRKSLPKDIRDILSEGT